MVLSSGVTTLLHMAICWTMVFKSGLGNRRAACHSKCYILLDKCLHPDTLCQVFSFMFKNMDWIFKRGILHGIFSFLTLAIPLHTILSTLFHVKVILFFPILHWVSFSNFYLYFSNILEMWSFEMMVLLFGLLPNPELEASVQ